MQPDQKFKVIKCFSLGIEQKSLLKIVSLNLKFKDFLKQPKIKRTTNVPMCTYKNENDSN